MKFIVPVAVTESRLTSSTIAEPSLESIVTSAGATVTVTPAVWSASSTYLKGAYCIMTTNIHKIYECIVAVSPAVNSPPNTNSVSATPSWREVSSTTKWKMFDAYGSTKSIADSGETAITIVLTPSTGINSVALIGLESATSVTISTTVSGLSTYSETTSVSGKTDFVATNLVADTTAIITITINGVTGETGKAKVGKIEIGNYFELGDINYGSSVGIIDYSTKTTDNWGNTTIVKRVFTKRITAKLTILNSAIDSVANKLAAYRSTPLVWIGNENLYTSLIVYGFYRDFDINIAYPMQSDCSLTIEGIN